MTEVYAPTQATPTPRFVEVPSFTDPEVAYRNDRKKNYCPCPAGKFSICRKHRNLAKTTVPTAIIEGAWPTTLSNGSKCLVLYEVYKEYWSRTRGYDSGAWTHRLCFDGKEFYLDSHHQSCKVKPVLQKIRAWDKWEEYLPATRWEIHPPRLVFNR